MKNINNIRNINNIINNMNNIMSINNVRMDGFKLEGGELFKEGFRKLLSQE